jgi:phenylalanine-4-hydroxylase
MIYQGIHFEKQSRIINCRTPFEKDPTVIDYEQDSDEEWEELYGENLEDDEMLEEENMEVFEDEAEKLNMPNAGISSDMKQKLAFRSQYCYQSLQFKEDDPELKKEGFIVADDYFS